MVSWVSRISCRRRATSRDGYEDNIPPSGLPVGSAEEAPDGVCGLYLADPTAWLTAPSTN
jgi:hypothetical protein